MYMIVHVEQLYKMKIVCVHVCSTISPLFPLHSEHMYFCSQSESLHCSKS